MSTDACGFWKRTLSITPSTEDVAEAGREVNPLDLYRQYFLPKKSMIDGFTGERPVLVRRFDRVVGAGGWNMPLE